MGIYNFYSRHKTGLLWSSIFVTIVIFCGQIVLTQYFATQIINEEINKINIWAEGIRQKVSLISNVQLFSESIAQSEQEKLDIWADAYKRYNKGNEDFDFYRRVVQSNTTIPFIVVDTGGNIVHCQNLNFDCSRINKIPDSVVDAFSKYPPIEINDDNGDVVYYIYYQQSIIYSDFMMILSSLESDFINGVLNKLVSVSVICLSKDHKVVSVANIHPRSYSTREELDKTLNNMSNSNDPIVFLGRDNEPVFSIYYDDIKYLAFLKYYPVLTILMIITLVTILLFVYRISRNASENRLWSGLSRETAHQLGTPISSLAGWISILENVDKKYIEEMDKDIKRLNKIADRFSKIGSKPDLETYNIFDVVCSSVNYLQNRVSNKIQFEITSGDKQNISAKCNQQLFEWVIENLLKNSIDAMSSSMKKIIINISQDFKNVYIDITDNGVGIDKSLHKKIFIAGYTTKKRGWGLGLSLAKRIVKEYHHGNIFVLKSVIGKGTTMRVVLPK